MQAESANVQRARSDAVSRALGRWYADCATNADNVAFFYAAGHGVRYNSEDGGAVLLEDFSGTPPTVLAEAFDTANIRGAMAGPTMARTQFYFVDTCRIRPEYAEKVAIARAGVTLDVPNVQGRRASPIYFSAASDTLALGVPGKGTLFSQALIESLDLLATIPPDENDEGWHVSDIARRTLAATSRSPRGGTRPNATCLDRRNVRAAHRSSP